MPLYTAADDDGDDGALVFCVSMISLLADAPRRGRFFFGRGHWPTDSICQERWRVRGEHHLL